jgi:hypothetical protein
MFVLAKSGIKDIIQRNSNLSRSPDTIGFFAITPATGFFPDYVSGFVPGEMVPER